MAEQKKQAKKEVKEEVKELETPVDAAAVEELPEGSEGVSPVVAKIAALDLERVETGVNRTGLHYEVSVDAIEPITGIGMERNGVADATSIAVTPVTIPVDDAIVLDGLSGGSLSRNPVAEAPKAVKPEKVKPEKTEKAEKALTLPPLPTQRLVPCVVCQTPLSRDAQTYNTPDGVLHNDILVSCVACQRTRVVPVSLPTTSDGLIAQLDAATSAYQTQALADVYGTYHQRFLTYLIEFGSLFANTEREVDAWTPRSATQEEALANLHARGARFAFVVSDDLMRGAARTFIQAYAGQVRADGVFSVLESVDGSRRDGMAAIRLRQDASQAFPWSDEQCLYIGSRALRDGDLAEELHVAYLPASRFFDGWQAD